MDIFEIINVLVSGVLLAVAFLYDPNPNPDGEFFRRVSTYHWHIATRIVACLELLFATLWGIAGTCALFKAVSTTIKAVPLMRSPVPWKFWNITEERTQRLISRCLADSRCDCEYLFKKFMVCYILLLWCFGVLSICRALLQGATSRLILAVTLRSVRIREIARLGIPLAAIPVCRTWRKYTRLLLFFTIFVQILLVEGYMKNIILSVIILLDKTFVFAIASYMTRLQPMADLFERRRMVAGG